MKLTDLTVTDFLAAIQSPDPTPGGGSAAALSGALGASLLAMVAGLPKSRVATEEDAERLAAAGVRCRELAGALRQLVDADAESYDRVTAAYKRPKGTDEEKAARSAAIQDALKTATETPLDVMRACAAAVEQGAVVAEFGNPSAASDVKVGVGLLLAGVEGARENVAINLGSIKDADYAEKVRRDAAEYARGAGHEAAAARGYLPVTS